MRCESVGQIQVYLTELYLIDRKKSRRSLVYHQFRSEAVRLRRKVKFSVPLTPAGTSLAEGILHAPKACLSGPMAHLVKKKDHPLGGLSFSGGRYRTRTYDLPHVKRML